VRIPKPQSLVLCLEYQVVGRSCSPAEGSRKTIHELLRAYLEHIQLTLLHRSGDLVSILSSAIDAANPQIPTTHDQSKFFLQEATHTSHPNPKQSPNPKKLRKCVAIRSPKLQHGNDNKVHNHWPLSAIKIPRKTKDRCSDGPISITH